MKQKYCKKDFATITVNKKNAVEYWSLLAIYLGLGGGRNVFIHFVGKKSVYLQSEVNNIAVV